MALVNQASKLPTRKIMAVILSGMILGGIQSGLRLVWPDHPFAPYMEDVDIWLQGTIMVLAGYLTKEKADEPTNTTEDVQGASDSDDAQLVLPFVRMDEEEAGEVGNGKQASQGKGGASK